jgi:hypothetical protein
MRMNCLPYVENNRIISKILHHQPGVKKGIEQVKATISLWNISTKEREDVHTNTSLFKFIRSPQGRAIANKCGVLVTS